MDGTASSRTRRPRTCEPNPDPQVESLSALEARRQDGPQRSTSDVPQSSSSKPQSSSTRLGPMASSVTPVARRSAATRDGCRRRRSRRAPLARDGRRSVRRPPTPTPRTGRSRRAELASPAAAAAARRRAVRVAEATRSASLRARARPTHRQYRLSPAELVSGAPVGCRRDLHVRGALPGRAPKTRWTGSRPTEPSRKSPRCSLHRPSALAMLASTCALRVCSSVNSAYCPPAGLLIILYVRESDPRSGPRRGPRRPTGRSPRPAPEYVRSLEAGALRHVDAMTMMT